VLVLGGVGVVVQTHVLLALSNTKACPDPQGVGGGGGEQAA